MIYYKSVKAECKYAGSYYGILGPTEVTNEYS